MTGMGAFGPVASRTIYARRRFQSLAGPLAVLGLALAARSHGSDGLAIGLASFAALVAVYLLRRPRLQAGPGGLTVVNFVRTYRVPWGEIAGFGLGSGRLVSRLAIRRHDGSTVDAAAVMEDVRAGYSIEEVEEIVADLQDRLAAANGTSVERGLLDVVPTAGPRSRIGSLRLTQAVWVAVCLFFVVLGAATAWKAASDLPQTYSRLSARGLPATAVFAGCRVRGIRTHECSLSLTDGGRTRTWSYGQDFPQFRGLPVGAPVDVLVDPDDPTTVYTDHDVAVRYDAGFGPLGIFGVALAVAGVVGLAWFVWLRGIVRARTRRLLEEAAGPPPGRA